LPERRELDAEFVEKVEKFKIMPIDKAYILLTASGLKPASLIDFRIRPEDANEAAQAFGTEQDFDDVVSTIKQADLPFGLRGRSVIKNSYYGDHESEFILIGRGDQELENLQGAMQFVAPYFEGGKKPVMDLEMIGEMRNNPKFNQYNNELGLALGFPPSAVEAYVGGNGREKLDKSTLPEHIQKGDAIAFCAFALSKDNWEEELKQAQTYADFIKSASPVIYQEIVGANKEE